MDTNKKAQIKAHVRAIAALLYEKTDPEQVQTLAGIEDIQILTGVAVAHSTQQRLVHRQTLELPQAKTAVDELSVDGGKVRTRTGEQLY